MKKDWVALVLAIIALLVALFVLITSPAIHAQERCGEWVETKGLLNIEDFLLKLDSVWIPKSCVPIERDTIWDHQYVISDTLIVPPGQMTMDMLFDSLTAEIKHLKTLIEKWEKTESQ